MSSLRKIFLKYKFTTFEGQNLLDKSANLRPLLAQKCILYNSQLIHSRIFTKKIDGMENLYEQFLMLHLRVLTELRSQFFQNQFHWEILEKQI